MDVKSLQAVSPEVRVRLLFLINNGDQLLFGDKFSDDFQSDALAAQNASRISLEHNTIEDIDNALKERINDILSPEIMFDPPGTPCGDFKITKSEIDFLVLHSACKYLKIPHEEIPANAIYKKLNFTEDEVNSFLPLDAEKLQYIDLVQYLDTDTVWKIWIETNKQSDVFIPGITLIKPESEALKQALFYMILRQLQLKSKINRIYTGKLISILNVCQVRKSTVDKLRSYPQATNPSGFCVIFCVLENRDGAETEFKKISETFKRLGFVVHGIKNPTLEHLENMRSELNKPKYMFYNSLVCWFISHGNSHMVKLIGGEIKRNDILQKFTNLKSFRKSPRVMFMVSCLGKKDLTLQEKGTYGYKWAHDGQPKGKTEFLDFPDGMIDITAVHCEMDRLVAYSTLDEHYSYRCEVEGSLYVDRVCNLLNQDENQGRNITEILEETAQELHQILIQYQDEEESSQKKVKQGCRYESTLQKTFKIPSKNAQ